jgi:hypothetical protein
MHPFMLFCDDKPAKFGNRFVTIIRASSGLLIDNSLRKQEGTDVRLHRTPRRPIQPLTLDRTFQEVTTEILSCLPCDSLAVLCCTLTQLLHKQHSDASD